MEGFAKTLISLRKNKGHKSARSFYKSLFQTDAQLFNYSYYMKIEKGQVLPSQKIVDFLAKRFGENGQNALIMAFCQDQFPDYSYLFQHYEIPQEKIEPKNLHKTVVENQEELTLKQVSILGDKRENYELFLLATLAREPINFVEITDIIAQKKVLLALKELHNEGIIIFDGQFFKAHHLEYRFPSPYNDQLKSIYKQLDQWDLEFGKRFKFEAIINKMFTRRISLRYFGIIQKHLEVLFEMVRSSDEVDQLYNDRVIQLVVNLSSGKLAG